MDKWSLVVRWWRSSIITCKKPLEDWVGNVKGTGRHVLNKFVNFLKSRQYIVNPL